jgi:predicted RNase H-like HicB family nuclease
MEYLVILERADDGSFSVHAPDLPGCVSCGVTEQEALQMVEEAIRGHIELMRESGEAVPPPRSTARTVQAA